MTPSIEALVKVAEAFLDDARKHTGALWTKNHELNLQVALANLKGEQTEPDGKTLLGHTKAEWEFHINELFAAALDGEEIPEAALLYGWQGKLTAEDFDWAKRKLAELATPKPAPERVGLTPEVATRRSCNRHSDCEAAENEVMQRRGIRRDEISFSFHCHSEDCEDCFGC